MTFVTCDGDNRRDMVAQIGRVNLLSISGGRVTPIETGIALPVSNGYSVQVHLDGNDTYVVRRVFTRAGKVSIKGERTNVYCDELSEAAYYASCFRSYDAETWPTKVA